MSSQVEIHEIPTEHAPIDLLLLADPSESKIRSYLETSKCFIISRDNLTLGACIVKPLDAGSHELMSIAVQPDHQNCGLGAALLKWVIDYYRKAGAKNLIVGTGTFGYQLGFYQRQGFRVTSIEYDYFINNYSEPIIENDIQLFDMLKLTLNLKNASI